ncbi:PilC/PilY family type IV pilus protein [Ferrimonas senticii]|uniref:PilC/PilY family type IV pilus protein n=1 Tax=Ferrimonas senticii TaxID=394566 RepID=UPI0004293A15|nr:PilC/PilY family type IV pilus protein [Ferrimonas senticii]
MNLFRLSSRWLWSLSVGFCSVVALADDTEIFFGISAQSAIRPQVLLILDNSGSMTTVEPGTDKTRMRLAKDTLQRLVLANPEVDFGLAVFNFNEDQQGIADGNKRDNGGRIVQGIDANRDDPAALLGTIEALPAKGWTPLCETLFESYRYFSGGAVFNDRYQQDDSNSGNDHNLPLADRRIVDADGRYRSPLTRCQAPAYVVLISDGNPTRDSHYNQQIITEFSAAGFVLKPYSDQLVSEQYLPVVAEFLFQQDLQPQLAGQQRVVTHTIGFAEGAVEAAGVLTETANRGGGRYHAAADVSALQRSLQQIVAEVLAANGGFTSPAVAFSAGDRTNTGEALYYGVFAPSDRPRWHGNLKKLVVTPQGTVVDQQGNLAIDGDGDIAAEACTLWTSSLACQATRTGGDGAQVSVGGVAAALQNQPQRRLLQLNHDQIVALSGVNMLGHFNGEANLRQRLGLTEGQPLDDYWQWLQGIDVDDEDSDGDVSERRASVFGDPLHSKPLALRFGHALGDESDDVRLLIGTNHGYLHMFQDHGTSVSESWALYLPELLGNVPTLRRNAAGVGHSVYGVDGVPVAYLRDNDGDGRIGVDDSAWLFFGLRRGGSSYYALDISQPDQPQLMWQIDSEMAGFAQLGQSWSEPLITRLPGIAQPVLLVAAGYDPNKDQRQVGSNDVRGRAVLVIDAGSGQLLHQFSSEAGVDNTLMAVVDSIPGNVSALDSDYDGVSDRLYVGDSGGHIWRIDMPSADRRQWSANLFADLGGETITDDRRFFAEVAVAQTQLTLPQSATLADGSQVVSQRPLAYDAVVVGSGNRAHPNGQDTEDHLYVLQDRHIDTQHWHAGNPFPKPLTVADLHNVATTLPEQLQPTLDLQRFSQQRGWYYPLAVGEKSLSAPVLINGIAYFSTYLPQSAQGDTCATLGYGNLHGLQLHYGQRQLTLALGQRLPDSPQWLVPPAPQQVSESWLPALSLVGVGAGENRSGTLATGLTLAPRQIYYHYGGN